MRDRLLNVAETVAFGCVWIYVIPVIFVLEWLGYGDLED